MKQKTIVKNIISVIFCILCLFCVAMFTGCEEISNKNNSNTNNEQQNQNEQTQTKTSQQISAETVQKLQNVKDVTAVEGSVSIFGGSNKELTQEVLQEHLEVIVNSLIMTKMLEKENSVYQIDACSYVDLLSKEINVSLDYLLSAYLNYSYPDSLNKAINDYKLMITDIKNSQIVFYYTINYEYENYIQYNKLILDINNSSNQVTKATYIMLTEFQNSGINGYVNIEYNFIDNSLLLQQVEDKEKVENIVNDVKNFYSQKVDKVIISKQVEFIRNFGKSGSVLLTAQKINGTDDEVLSKLLNAYPSKNVLFELNADLAKYIDENSLTMHFSIADKIYTFTLYDNGSSVIDGLKKIMYSEYDVVMSDDGDVDTIIYKEYIKTTEMESGNITEVINNYTYNVNTNERIIKTITPDDDEDNLFNTYKAKIVKFSQK